MKPKYTPGPWSIHECGKNEKPFAVRGEKETFLSMSRHVGSGEKIITDVVMMDCKDGGYPRVDNPEECIANTNLIAAAPELLEALNECVRAWESGAFRRGQREGEFSAEQPPHIIAAREAIDKALGFVGMDEPTPEYDCPIHGKAASADGVCGRC